MYKMKVIGENLPELIPLLDKVYENVPTSGIFELAIRLTRFGISTILVTASMSIEEAVTGIKRLTNGDIESVDGLTICTRFSAGDRIRPKFCEDVYDSRRRFSNPRILLTDDLDTSNAKDMVDLKKYLESRSIGLAYPVQI